MYQDGSFLPKTHQDGSFLPGVYQDGSFLPGAYQDGSFLPKAHHNGRLLSGTHQDSKLLLKTHQDGSFLPGACQEPIRTVRTIRKIKILLGPPGGLQELSRRLLRSWHPNNLLMQVVAKCYIACFNKYIVFQNLF